MATRTRWLLAIIVTVQLGVIASPTRAATVQELVAEADQLAHADDASPATLQRAVGLYQDAARIVPGNARIQVGLAEAALDAGGLAGPDALRWYETGQAAAERAIAIDAGLADAHFLLAANRGRAAKLRPPLEVRPSIVGALEGHLARALALDPRHARALHMMGMLLRDTPLFLRGYLTGKASAAPRYLIAAVEADSSFAEARLDLAEYYRSTGRVADARAHAKAVIEMSRGTPARLSREKYRAAAEAFLKTLPAE